MEDTGITLCTIMKYLLAIELHISKRFDEHDKEFILIHKRMDRVENTFIKPFDALDERLDPVEIHTLPKRVSTTEKHLLLAA